MRVVGIIAVSLAATGALAAAFVGLRSIPDIRRYLKIRSM